MRLFNLLAASVLVAASFLAGLAIRGLPASAEGGAGGETVATKNGDCNGDGNIDLNDPIWLLN